MRTATAAAAERVLGTARTSWRRLAIHLNYLWCCVRRAKLRRHHHCPQCDALIYRQGRELCYDCDPICSCDIPIGSIRCRAHPVDVGGDGSLQGGRAAPNG